MVVLGGCNAADIGLSGLMRSGGSAAIVREMTQVCNRA